MLPTGNCSHHGSVEGVGWGGGTRPSRTINKKLKGWWGRSHKGIQDKGTFTRTMCTSTVIYRYSSPSSFQLSENKQTKKVSGRIQRSNNTAGRMEQSPWPPRRSVRCVWGAVHTYIQGPCARSDSAFGEVRRASSFHTCTRCHATPTSVGAHVPVSTRSLPVTAAEVLPPGVRSPSVCRYQSASSSI